MIRVLFIDDEADLWSGRLKRHLSKHGLELVEERRAEQALERISDEQPDVVLLDVMFPGVGGRLEPKGMSLSGAIAQRFPRLPVVMFTSTLADASYGIEETDFPSARFLFSKDHFGKESAVDPYSELAAQLIDACRQSEQPENNDEHFGFVVGDTPQMRVAVETILRAARTESTVLIAGESGTGKELVARSIHQFSHRSQGKLLAVNCGALTDQVLESTLFGHERGAFTGADRQHLGLFEQAHRGSLFLDEVDAMSPALQDKLLRVIEDGCVRRMGSQTEVQADVRLIVATNKRLLQLVEQGRFRQDLYYRICVVQIDLPPLRERTEDIPALFRALVLKLNKRLGKNIAIEPRPDVVSKLCAHSWPGNIREFEHTLERAMIAARANVLTPSAVVIEGGQEMPRPSPTALGLVQKILAGKAGWKEMQAQQVPARGQLLEQLIREIARQQNRIPSSSQLAKVLGTSEGNMRRILSESGVRLRQKSKQTS